jgi:hypothetical protein
MTVKLVFAAYDCYFHRIKLYLISSKVLPNRSFSSFSSSSSSIQWRARRRHIFVMAIISFVWSSYKNYLTISSPVSVSLTSNVSIKWYLSMPCVSFRSITWVHMKKLFEFYTQGQEPWKEGQICFLIYHFFHSGVLVYIRWKAGHPCSMNLFTLDGRQDIHVLWTCLL